MKTPLTFTQRLAIAPSVPIGETLSLTADERTKTRRYVETDSGQGIYLRLPRGTVIYHGDVLTTENSQPGQETQRHAEAFVHVIAKPEPVMTVNGKAPFDLLRAAYHLGNRHVPVELTPDFLRFSPDPVLKSMLEQMGLEVIDEICPFQPEAGAYSHHHVPSTPHHPHDHVS